MIYYSDNDLVISFSQHPDKVIHERIILSSLSKEEKKDYTKYPLINSKDLEFYVLDRNKKNYYTCLIEKGTKSDGATIPFIFWSILCITPTDPRVIIAAYIHDFFCKNKQVIGYDKDLSTKVFERLLYVGGLDPIRRFIMKHSVNFYQNFCGWKK